VRAFSNCTDKVLIFREYNNERTIIQKSIKIKTRNFLVLFYRYLSNNNISQNPSHFIQKSMEIISAYSMSNRLKVYTAMNI